MSGKSGCFELLFWFSSAILLTKMKSILFNLWTKIWQSIHVILESTNQFFHQILHQSSVPSNNTPLYFYSSKIWWEEPIKLQIVEIFECSGHNLSNSSCQFCNDKSIPPSVFHNFSLSWQVTSTVNFKVIHFLLYIKESHQGPNLETFKCSGENSSNFSCYFWMQKPVFL